MDLLVLLLFLGLILYQGVKDRQRVSPTLEGVVLSDRDVPWLKAGISMMAVGFAAQTPITVVSLIRTQGLQFLAIFFAAGLGAVLSAIFFAGLLRRSQIVTIAEFYELRYSGLGAKILRFTTALFGILVGIAGLSIGIVGLAKILSALQTVPPIFSTVLVVIVTLGYSATSGLRGIIRTDALQFLAAILGSLILAVYVLIHVGGLGSLIDSASVLSVGPLKNPLELLPGAGAPLSLLLALSANFLIVWWMFGLQSTQDFTVPLILSARSDRDASLAVLWYAFISLLVRTWPWAIAAIASLVLIPNISDPELAYPYLLRDYLPGLARGIVLASLVGAFMSTVDSGVNLLAALFVNDLYRRYFCRTQSHAHYAMVARLSIVGFGVTAGMVALIQQSVVQGLLFLSSLTAGLAPVVLLRWYWWKITAWVEMTATISSVIVTLVLFSISFFNDPANWPLLLGANVIITAFIWLPLALLGPGTDNETQRRFLKRAIPPFGSWTSWPEDSLSVKCRARVLRRALFLWIIGATVFVAGGYGIGMALFGPRGLGLVFCGMSGVASWFLFRAGPFIGESNPTERGRK